MPEPECVRTSPGTALVMTGDRTIVHCGDVRAGLELPDGQLAAFVRTLAALSEWQSPAAAAAAIGAATGTSQQRSAAQLRALVQAGVVEPADRDPHFADAAEWERFGWAEAYRYHRHLRLLPIVDWSLDASVRADAALMRDYLAAEEQPSPYLVRDADDRVPVGPPAAGRAGPIADTRTAPAARPLAWSDLATTLALAFGRTGTRRLPVTGTHLTKTSPSGGSRHPNEAFVFVLRDLPSGPPPGRYHFNVRDSTLDCLSHGGYAGQVRESVIRLRDRPAFEPVAVVVLVAVCERSMFRYRESRSYRVLLHDAGHLLQTFAYVGSSLGRPTYRGYTVDEPAVTRLLDLDPLAQIPLAFGVIG